MDCWACRAVCVFSEYEFLKNSHSLVLFVTVAAIITVGPVLFYFNFFWSIFKGQKLRTIRGATTLEWVTASPPPHDNFAGFCRWYITAHTSFRFRERRIFVMQKRARRRF